MLTHALVKVPTKEAATPALPFHAPAAAPVANTVSPAAPKNIAGVQRTLLHPISGKVSPADVSTVANTPAAREAHPVSSFLGRTLPNLSGRTGAGIGAAVGGLLGAAMPGKDDEGDERSAVGGALRGMAGGALAGGAAGMVGRRALINPMVKNLQAHPDVTKAVAKQRADVASGQAALGQQKVHDNRIAQSYNVHPNNITDTMRAHDAEHQKVLAANPNAVRNLADIHQGPALRASFEASMKNLDAPSAHSDWLHQNVVSKMEPAAVSAGLSKLHAAAGHQPAAPAPTGFIPKLKNWLGTSGEAHSYTLPADEASQRKQLSVALSHAAQHGFHADASQAVGVPVPSHQQLASATAPQANPLPSMDVINAAGQNVEGMLRRPAPAAPAPVARRGQVVPIRTLDAQGNEVIGHHRYAGSDPSGQHYVHGQGIDAGRILPVNENQIVQLQ